MQQHKHLLRRYLRPQGPKLAVLMALLFANIALELVAPMWMSKFIDGVQNAASIEALTSIALVFMLFTLARPIVMGFAGYLAEDVGWRSTNAIRTDLTRHCLSLDLSFHRSRTPGELMERVDGDVAELHEFLSFFVFAVIGRLLLAIGIIVLAFVADYRIGLLLLAFALSVVVILRRTQRIAMPRSRALRETRADLSSFVEERLAARESIVANGGRRHMFHQLYEKIAELVERTRASMVASRYASSLLEVMVALAGTGVLALGAYLLPGKSITLGQIYLGYYYTQLLSLSLTVVTMHMDGLQRAGASIARISELTGTETRVPSGPGRDVPRGAAEVEFTGVDFGYGERQQALSDVSFRLAPAQTLGLLGRTGSGKTTITRLLCRDHDVNAGTVRLGGVDVREFTLEQLRSRISMVTQDVQLFHASLRDNLTLFDATVPDERILAALAELHLTDWYAGLPDGLDTVLTDGGGSLSAGEAQLVALTRAFLDDPDVVVLDEASSRLDPSTEQMVEEATTRLLDGRTGIVVAHRLKTVRRLDRILILEDGRVRESGDRSALAADPDSRFAALLSGGKA
ncbi:ABC transporter ATP-binding protein [Micromonospora sp. NPDC005298]|uniref:ABC transporter ATP-binding protein n=1 Tax=Micromonospora sp. NPDC005298 TaxID=3156873 RepID=UPI0033B038C8